MSGEILISEKVEYLNCKAGDNVGRLRVMISGEVKIFTWDSISWFEHQALAEAIDFVNKNK